MGKIIDDEKLVTSKSMYRDILVVGAGVLGLSSALHLKKMNPEKNVVLIDKLGGPGQGNTAKSAGIFLNLFTTDLNYCLGDSTIDWFYHLQNDLGHNLNLVQYGYLYLLDKHRYGNLSGSISDARKLGVDISIFDVGDLKSFMPELITDFGVEELQFMDLKPVYAGVLAKKCGSVNTDALARSLEAEFLKCGGEVHYNTIADKLILKPKKEIGLQGEPFVWQDIHIEGARTNRGEIQAERTVVASGAWSERLLDPIGFDSLMRPKKRVIFVFDNPKIHKLINSQGFNEDNLLPFTQIPEITVYLKVEPTEGSIWLGCSDDFGRKYGLEDDPEPERELYINNIYHALVKYFPCFIDLRPINMWAGQRAINTVDKTPVVASTPGMIYVGSTSGYGITKSDALGRTVAALYSGEKEVELYGGKRIRTSDLGIDNRKVGKETFKV